MPYSTQRRIVGASVAIGIICFALLLTQRLRITGEHLMRLPAVAKGSQISNSSAVIYDSNAAGLHAYCNITGPCETCSSEEKAPESVAAKMCTANGHRQSMRCTVGNDMNTVAHEVRKDLPAEMQVGEAGSSKLGVTFDTYYPCTSTNSDGIGMAPFEWLMLAMLLCSLPVVYIRKKGGLEGLRTLLPV